MPQKPANAKKRQVSDAHKAAMAAGRDAGRAVNIYLHALGENRPKRGRRVPKEDLEKRLLQAQEEAQLTVGTSRLLALQTVEDLESRLKEMTTSATTSLADVEKGFVKVAKAYGDAKGISYKSWRSVGVPAEVLKRAGIGRTS